MGDLGPCEGPADHGYILRGQLFDLNLDHIRQHADQVVFRQTKSDNAVHYTHQHISLLTKLTYIAGSAVWKRLRLNCR